MTIEELLCYGKQYVHSNYAKLLLAELIDKNVLELYNNLHYIVDNEKVKIYKKQIQDLANGSPLQYVIGNVNFLGTRFYINKDVLIPRFETEELVDYTIKHINKYFHDSIDIIDLGCGSGVIGLTLEKNILNSTVDLVDISPDALKVAKKNKEQLNLNANLIQSDMWDNINKKYDVIISNPPYIKTNEEIEDIVKNNEPHIALYAGEEGLDCYNKIFANIKEHMKDRCLIAMEIGYRQGSDLTKLANKYLPDAKVEIKKDMSGKDRMIFIFNNLE